MMWRKILKVSLLGLAGLLGVTLILMLAAKLALDRVPQYQAQIKEWVHGRIGYHIAFSHVSPAFRWYGPELYFERLELRSKDDQRVLARADGGRIGADLWHLFQNGRLFAARIELDAPNILITRVGSDKFAVASEIELGGGTSSLPAMRLDDLAAGTLAVKHGFVTLQNWNASLPSLELKDLNLQVRRGEGGASVTIDVQLPAELGGSARVHGEAAGTGVLNTLSWTATARARDLVFAGWRQLLPEYLARLGAGSGAFELSARGAGSNLSRASLQFDAKNVLTQLTDEPSVRFDQVSGAFSLAHAGERWTMEGRRVQASLAGRRDPDSEFDVTWREGIAGLVEVHARASYLRAGTLLPLAGLLPQKDLRQRMQEVAPTGEWMDTHVDLVRDAAIDPWRLNAAARFRGVGFAPAGRAPGIRGLSGSLAGNENGGHIDIDGQSGIFTWPAELAQPVELQRFKTTLYWKRTAEELLVATPSVELKIRDAELHGRLAWHQPSDGTSPLLTLVLAVDNGNVVNTHLYLPKLLIAPVALTWLNRAFITGRLTHADVVLQGPLRHYPFRDGSGLFLARAHMEGLTLDYKEGWPVAENLTVVAEFRNEGLNVQLASGHIGRLTLESGDARFADFKTGELQLRTKVSGDASDALGYLRATPLDASAEHVFSSVEANGPVTTDVDLFLPFKDFDHRRTLVHEHLDGVSLNRVGWTLKATELTGDADIDGAQVARADIRGRVLGGAFQMQARAPRNRPVTRTILAFNGVFSGEALHSALSLPSGVAINGNTDWHGVLRMAPEPARERSLRLSGSLAGLELNLPEPLAKPAGHPLPSSVEIQWPVSGGPEIRMDLGAVVRGQVTLDSDASGPTLGRAAVTFGTSQEPPAFSNSQMVNTGGTIGRLDLAGWLKLYTPDKNAKPLGNFLRTAKFEVAQVDYLGMSFLDVGVDLAVSEAGWLIGLGGPNVVGSISVPSGARAADPWKLEFERLNFVDGPGRDGPGHDGPAQEAAPAQDDSANPRAVPSMDFHAAELTWNDRQFGDVRATLSKLEDGISLKQLVVTSPVLTASATGEWRGKGAGLGRIEGNLSSLDVGAALKQLGYEDVVEAKTGKVDFDLNWIGAPTGEALSLAAGHVQVALDKGQLTSIKPGAGRVVGLASLAALPRHLSLDFSDLTDKGLAFDTIRGDFDLRDGSAFTDNVVVKGPAAEIGLIGRVGLKNKDYDQTAEVTGNVNSTLPLAAFVAGPVIGGAVLVFSQVFKETLKGLARGYYRITGGWDNPTVERINSAEAAAATAEAPK